MNRSLNGILLIGTLLAVLGGCTVCDNDNLDFIRENFFVYKDNITAVNEGLPICSVIPSYLDQISFRIQNEKLTGNIELDIGDNIKYLSIDKMSSENITITVPNTLTGILRLEFKSQQNWFILESADNFFDKFPNLQDLDAENIILNDIPSFAGLSALTRIQVVNSRFLSGSDTAVDGEFVSGLQNLVLLSWKESTLNTLADNTFNGLDELTELSLENNDIEEIRSAQFSNLTKLIELDLSHNNLTTFSVQSNAFVGLTSLQILRMNSNPLFSPNIVFHPLFNLTEIYLQNNMYTSLDFRAFQQKTKLKTVFLFGDNMFDCICNRTEWMANVNSRFNIEFLGGACDTPTVDSGTDVTEVSLYTECASEFSYECFDATLVNCTAEQICVNTFNSFACECQGGFAEIINPVTMREECLDVDECVTETDNCEQICINLEGSFFCRCEAGYDLVQKTRCDDIDECVTQSNDTCYEEDMINNEICENTNGSFICNCRTGFRQETERNCVDLNECLSDNNCTQVCVNTPGDYKCECRMGFQFTTEVANYSMNSTMNTTNTTNVTRGEGNKGVECVDIDECRIQTDMCEQLCNNTIGSYNCSCVMGFNLTDRFNCTDIDECAINTTLCDDSRGMRCNNTRGSYECICKEGYVQGNMTCIKPDALSTADIIGISISGFFVITFFIVVILILICCVFKRSRQSVRQKGEGTSKMLASGFSTEQTDEMGKEHEKTGESKKKAARTVANEYELESCTKDNTYEVMTSVTKEETVETGYLSASAEKQLLAKELEEVGTATNENTAEPEVTSSDETTKYRQVLI